MRVVVDTNVWISALINPQGPPARILSALQQNLFALLVSEPLLRELAGVLARPRFAQRFDVTPDKVAELLALLRARGELVEITGAIRLCRDPTDDMVVETALNGRADVLVSRDDDLKGASDLIARLEEHGIAVLTVRPFLAALESAPT